MSSIHAAVESMERNIATLGEQRRLDTQHIWMELVEAPQANTGNLPHR